MSSSDRTDVQRQLRRARILELGVAQLLVRNEEEPRGQEWIETLEQCADALHESVTLRQITARIAQTEGLSDEDIRVRERVRPGPRQQAKTLTGA